FTVAAVVVLSLGVRSTFGFYSHVAFGLTMLALALGLLACILPDRTWLIPRSANLRTAINGQTALLAVAALFPAAGNIASTDLWYAEAAWAPTLLSGIAFSGCAVTVLGIVALGGTRAALTDAQLVIVWRCVTVLITIVLCLGLALRACVIHASPDPVI